MGTEKIIKESDKRKRKSTDTAPGHVYVVIPLRATAAGSIDFNETLIRRTLESIGDSRYVSRVFICSENEELLHIARQFSVVEYIPRPEKLALENVRVARVLAHAAAHLEENGYEPEIVVPVEITYPFRPKGLIDALVGTLLENRVDSAVAAFREYRPCWLRTENGLEQLTNLSRPRTSRRPVHVGVPSLGCATYADLLRRGERMGGEVALYEIDDPLAAIEIRSREELQRIAEQFYWPE